MAMEVEIRNPQVGYHWWSSGRRRFEPDDPFFASGNIERELLAKQIALDVSEDEKQQLHTMEIEDIREIFCPIVGCGARLKSLDNFEDHYNARHTASCSICYRVYPTSRLLSIHVSESHDSFFQAKVARGFPMYECLVESCGMKLKSYKSRQQHLVDKHNFPTSFEFFKKAQPSKKHRRQNINKTQRKEKAPPPLIQHKKKEDEEEEEDEVSRSAMEVEKESINIDGLVSAVSKLSTASDSSSPSSVSFGRKHTRGLAFVPRAVQRVKKPD